MRVPRFPRQMKRICLRWGMSLCSKALHRVAVFSCALGKCCGSFDWGCWFAAGSAPERPLMTVLVAGRRQTSLGESLLTSAQLLRRSKCCCESGCRYSLFCHTGTGGNLAHYKSTNMGLGAFCTWPASYPHMLSSPKLLQHSALSSLFAINRQKI